MKATRVNSTGWAHREWSRQMDVAMWGGTVPRIEEFRDPPDRSPAERLLDTIESHVSAEAGSLEEYRRLAEHSADPVVKLLAELVLGDEERHHHLLERIATSLAGAVHWWHPAEALPSLTVQPEPAAREAIEATRALIREEHAGARELRQLARREKRLAGGLETLLLETMAIDSEKHERILRFVLKRLESSGADKN